ncbi:MAG: methyltransferase domain-containing protein [Nanoarchaeota archaeon]
MKYLFILGRNVELSLAEIFSYFERKGNKIKNYEIKKNAVLIDLEKPISKIIDNFGGVISIGEVSCEGAPQAYTASLKLPAQEPLRGPEKSSKKIFTEGKKELISLLEKKELYLGTKNKFNYCLWDFSKYEFVVEISGYLKKRFRSEKLKAVQKTLTGKINLQSGEKAQKVGSKLIEEEFFLFGEEKLYFGRIVEKCDYENLEKRDMSRPVRRESLSISPRLAKIMINLSQVRKNGKLLDSFCGVGVILQEALLQEIEVIGIDKDKKAIKGSKENLKFLNFAEEKYKLINWDSSTAKINEVNVLVTEPNLGETLKKIPTKEKAKKMLKNYENLMIKVLSNLSNLVLGKIVFTAPFIRIGKKRLSCDIERILRKTDLKLSSVKDIKFPIPEFRGNQIVGREIFVLD